MRRRLADCSAVHLGREEACRRSRCFEYRGSAKRKRGLTVEALHNSPPLSMAMKSRVPRSMPRCKAEDMDRTYILRPDVLAMIIQRLVQILRNLADRCGTCVPLAQVCLTPTGRTAASFTKLVVELMDFWLWCRCGYLVLLPLGKGNRVSN